MSLIPKLKDIALKAMNDGLTDEETGKLALLLANSGLWLESPISNSTDIASTGGPSSLSTLLCPLFLRLQKRTVIKLAVPGRPAGGLDVLATIPGYLIALTQSSIISALDVCGYAHFVANGIFAPLDLEFFKLRQVIGAQAVIPLVIASLLAKKIAVGVRSVGLDVRVAQHGNFGADRRSARENARRFIRVARNLGLNATCVLTDGTQPYQPYIGRGEALMALNEIFSGTASQWLCKHVRECSEMVSWIIGAEDMNVNRTDLKSAFVENLKCQGSSLAAFETKVEKVRSAPRISILAPTSGYVSYNLALIRTVLVGEQSRFTTPGFPDPAGVRLEVEPGSNATVGHPIISLRANIIEAQRIKQELAKSFSIKSTPLQAKAPMEIVCE